MKQLLDLLLNPMFLLMAGGVGLAAVLALVFKVPFFTQVWEKLMGILGSIYRELDSNWHEAGLLALLFLVDRGVFAIVAGAYLIARVLVDAYLAVRKG